MSRIVLGTGGSALALAQSRNVLSELSAEWPDVQILPRTIKASARGQASEELLANLLNGRINIAALSLDELPASLPGGLELAAVSKRLEPRLALVSKGNRKLGELPSSATVGVLTARDGAFVQAARKGLTIGMLSGDLDEAFALFAAAEVDALVLPASHLIQLGFRQYLNALLDAPSLPPAVGQGSVALVVRDDDHLAADIAYTMHHRPSFDRTLAERSFAKALSEQPGSLVGALATVSSDGELSLFGALTELGGELVIQAEVTGEASEARELGAELAQDVLEQIRAHAH